MKHFLALAFLSVVLSIPNQAFMSQSFSVPVDLGYVVAHAELIIKAERTSGPSSQNLVLKQSWLARFWAWLTGRSSSILIFPARLSVETFQVKEVLRASDSNLQIGERIFIAQPADVQWLVIENATNDNETAPASFGQEEFTDAPFSLSEVKEAVTLFLIPPNYPPTLKKLKNVFVLVATNAWLPASQGVPGL